MIIFSTHIHTYIFFGMESKDHYSLKKKNLSRKEYENYLFSFFGS